MSYSRRQLYALGEPLGDSVTRRKADGGLVLGDGGGGGGGSQPAQTQTQVSDLPEWARPYAERTLAKGEALTEGTTPAVYGGQRYAGLSNLQQQAIGSISTPEAYQKSLQTFMDPYAQNVIDIQKREAGRQSAIAGLQEAGQAVKSGAFGGARAGLVEAERQRNLGQLMGDIQQRGSEAAYQNAQQAMQRDVANKMQLGAIQQQDIQRPLDIAYQDFLAQKNYPYQQLSYMSNLIRGTPMGMSSQSQVYQAPGSMMGQMAGLGLGAYGLSKLGMFADGGSVDGYADGGSVTDKFHDSGAMLAEMDKLSDEQLQQILRSPVTPIEAQAAQQELAMRASERRGLANAYNQVPYDAQQRMVRAAGGGILAFAKGGDEGEYQPTSSYWEQMSNVLGLIPRGIKTLVSAPGYGFSDTNKSKGSATPEAASKTDTVPYNAINATRRSDYEPKAAPKAAGTKTGKQTPGVTATPAPAAEPSFLDDLKTAQEFFRNPEAETDRKALMELIAKQGNRAEDIRQQGLGSALAQFGFGMAAQAAKPGQPGMGGLGGVLRSAAAASPALAESAARTQQLAAAAADNNLKMQIEMRKYNIAENKNDRAGMIAAAQNIRMMRQQQAQLTETARHNKATEAIAASRASQSNTGLRAYYSGMGQARQLASREATKLWSDPIERSRLEKSGIKSYDQLLQQRLQQHMKYAMPIYGVTPDEGDED